MLHEIIQSAASMHEFLAFLDNKRITDGGFVDESKRNANQESQLLSIENFKLSYLRTISYQTKFLIHSMALHLVKNNNLCPDGTNKDNSQFLNKHRIVQELMKNLVEIYTKKLISKHHLEKLKASICHVDLNCSKCHESCMLTALITQKVLLILSLNDKNQDTLSVINKLIEDLFKINILCDNCRCRLPQARYNASKRADYGISLNPSRSTSQTKFSGSNACSLHQSRLKTPRVDTEYASSRNTISEDLSSVASTASSEKYLYHYHGNQFHNDSQATDRSEFYSLLPTEDMGISERGSITGQSSAYTSIKVPYTSLNPNTKLEVELPIKNSTEQRQDKYSKNKIYKGKEFKILKQTCQSTDALSDVQRDSVKRCAKRLQPKTQKQVNEPYLFGKDLQLPVERISSSKTNDETAYESVHVTSNINSMGSFTPGANNRSFCVQDIAGNLDNIDHLSCTSNCSSHSLMNLVNQLEDTNKLSTVEVKLKNEGTGYGLSIEFLNQSTGMEVPSITSVNPQGAAHKIGVLLKGDRVLAINGRNTFGLTTEEFESLKDEAFGSEEILLVIEFDIAVREIKYGTFDISITKTSKTGLIYKDSPLVVKGIVKGSPAHRSGELFPGDEILFAKNICQEAFDAFKNTIERIETVIVTVRRLPCEDQQDEVTCSSNLSIDNTSEPSPFIRGSKTFNVLRTSIHSDHATDTLFLVQELTLSRDPVLNDFGFLVGQDPSNKMVYITGIRPSGPAECSKVIRINDGILEVNGISLRNSTEGQILSLFQQVGDTLKMKTRRVMRPE
ncbi:hypothetical protein CEXT_222011 [Caerostris extrusa]|uniref:PDZ domain-containing protein n=1 Tax=Caerostris extrusa TaxID=172846 RepID=A0AAV4VUB8_CAEEX|nr:hypothetical protein CEXT_222011 [Caerostris extrusa]